MKRTYVVGSVSFYVLLILFFYVTIKLQLSNEELSWFAESEIKDTMDFINTCRERTDMNTGVTRSLWTKRYKNPCFYKDSKLYCLPYFLVAGFPKCGTTDLFERLSYHPDFVRPHMKELHWLSRFRFLPVFKGNKTIDNYERYAPRRIFGLQLYSKMFDDLAEDLQNSGGDPDLITDVMVQHSCIMTRWCNGALLQLGSDMDQPIDIVTMSSIELVNKINDYCLCTFEKTGRNRDPLDYLDDSDIIPDFSPSTIWDNDMYTYMHELTGNDEYYARDFVHQLNPCMKLVIMMRDPVERLYSDYLFMTGKHTAKSFHSEVKHVIQLYKSCMKQRSIRECFNDYSLSRKSKIRLRIGAYSIFIEDWLKVFPREQMFFIRMEDYAANTEKVLTEIFDFLDMKPASGSTMKHMLCQKPSNTRKSRGEQYEPMYNQTYDLLSRFYAPFNQNLSILLQNTDYRWHNG